ncbi:hypothetical protein GALMADRAFT_136670 [Galerina marginata CBS 339.88]|uniref:F-box domain-containing protein n=1 Tax=Galerina marginata (strain CBS 339.88) TaxID=685588 RepID=A0A067TMD8_GALM3|nr:hypothetical protein GALMADRAFT_136670 [Galerina marginata CBS 339.88]
MQTPLHRLTPTPSESTLSESESDPPSSIPQAGINAQVDDGSQISTPISNNNVVAAVASAQPSEGVTASGSRSGVGVKDICSSTGKRKAREDDEEGSETEKDSQEAEATHPSAENSAKTKPLHFTKKRRFDSDADETDAEVQARVELATTETAGDAPAAVATPNVSSVVVAAPADPDDGEASSQTLSARSDDDAPAPAPSTDTLAEVPASNPAPAEKEKEASAIPASPTAPISIAIDSTDDEVTRPAKKARLDGDDAGQVLPHSPPTSATTGASIDTSQPPSTPEKPSPFLTIPLEILAEILILTGSSQHVLATARTCKVLCHTLLSPHAQFIWREARKGPGCTFEFEVVTQAHVNPAGMLGGGAWVMNGLVLNVLPGGAMGVPEPVKEKKTLTLPDPPLEILGEAAYAAFVFDSGKCECCGNETSVMYASFALRARLCKNNQCTAPASNLHHVRGEIENKLSEILPTNEASHCFTRAVWNGNAFWPEVQPKYCRPDEMFAAMADYELHFNVDDYEKKFELLKARNGKWMEFCVKLYKWTKVRRDKYYSNKAANESTGKKLASRYGWEHDDLMNTSYGGYERHKTKLIEKVDEVGISIEAQLLALAGKRERRNAEITLMKNRADVEAVYKRLRSGKLHPYLPALATFRQLPVISMLQSSERSSPSHSVAETLQNDKVMKELMMNQLKKWTEKAKQDLGVTLGFPKNWKSASKNVLHPVERVTARFLCMKCERVDAKYRADWSLDFAGACLHECGVGNQKKGKVRKSKVVWDAKNFVKDEKAINILKKAIEALGFGEDRDGGNYLLQVGHAAVCTSCEPCMVLDTRSLVGHSHRHDDMQVSFPSMENILSYMGGFPYHHGLVQKLLGPGSLSNAGKKEIDRKNYGCRHCLREKQVQGAAAATIAAASSSATENVGGDTGATHTQDTTVQQPSSSSKGQSASAEHIELSIVVYRMHDVAIEGPLERPPPLFNFNGIRSHLKSKHTIEDIRDEDILCYRTPDIML